MSMRNTMIIGALFLLFKNDLSDSSNNISYWINLRAPEALCFSGDSSFPGFSIDANIAINKHLFKISYSHANEDLPLKFDFISPHLKLKAGDLSYGYLFGKGRIMFNPNLAVGLAHYIKRGRLIPSEHDQYSIGNISSEYERIESTKGHL